MSLSPQQAAVNLFVETLLVGFSAVSIFPSQSWSVNASISVFLTNTGSSTGTENTIVLNIKELANPGRCCTCGSKQDLDKAFEDATAANEHCKTEGAIMKLSILSLFWREKANFGTEYLS
jgi:hypothetical protein